jgi:hypothetical protein
MAHPAGALRPRGLGRRRVDARAWPILCGRHEDVVPLPLIGRALDDELGGLPPRHC